MSELGHFDRGSRLCRPAHFRFALKADVRSYERLVAMCQEQRSTSLIPPGSNRRPDRYERDSPRKKRLRATAEISSRVNW